MVFGLCSLPSHQRDLIVPSRDWCGFRLDSEQVFLEFHPSETQSPSLPLVLPQTWWSSKVQDANVGDALAD